MIAAGLLCTALAACAPPPAPLPPMQAPYYAPPPAPPSSAMGAEILALHNAERQRAGVAPLNWDPALAVAALGYARTLAASGAFAHSSSLSRPGQGENLWRGTPRAYRVAEMVGGWIGERRMFRPGIFPAVSTSGRWQDVGHYSQIVWRRSTRLGCGLAGSPRADVLVCRYAPAGNVVGVAVP